MNLLDCKQWSVLDWYAALVYFIAGCHGCLVGGCIGLFNLPLVQLVSEHFLCVSEDLIELTISHVCGGGGTRWKPLNKDTQTHVHTTDVHKYTHMHTHTRVSTCKYSHMHKQTHTHTHITHTTCIHSKTFIHT